MIKIAKFGGSSVADAEHFKKIKAIVDADPARRFVVVSACGRRFKGDTKVTDLLYLVNAHVKYHVSCEELLEDIGQRYFDIADELELTYPIREEFAAFAERARSGGYSTEELVSRGEYFTARLMAEYLGLPFLDAATVVAFHHDGTLSMNRTSELVQEYGQQGGFVMPGFYGATREGQIKLLDRGGGDISGSILAKCLGADLYENWTDVSGFYSADPRIVPEAQPIARVTYEELRELSYMGASVLHEEAVFPVREAGIPLVIKNTNAPQDPGTIISETADEGEAEPIITGVTGKRGFVAINVARDRTKPRVGFMRRALSVFERYDVSVEHMPTGVDRFGAVVQEQDVHDSLYSLVGDIQQEVEPLEIEVVEGLALIATVGRNLRGRAGISGHLFGMLGQAGVSVRMISQSCDEINIIIGVEEKDFDLAIRTIYRAFSDENGIVKVSDLRPPRRSIPLWPRSKSSDCSVDFWSCLTKLRRGVSFRFRFDGAGFVPAPFLYTLATIIGLLGVRAKATTFKGGSMKQYTVAILGATGAVGTQMLECLNEQEFPVGKLKLLASARSAGKTVEFRGEQIVIEEACPEAFEGCDIVLGAAGDDIAKELLPEAVKRGAVVVDNSHAFRMDPEVPLVVPEINADDIKWHHGLIANPNCATIIGLVPTWPLHQLAGVKRMIVSTYQAASGAGAPGMAELEAQLAALGRGEEIPEPHAFAAQLASNLIPQIGGVKEEGFTSEEMKLQNEGRKIMHLPELRVNCTCVRVPVLRSHSESITLEFERDITVEEARAALATAPGVKLVDDMAAEDAHDRFPMPMDTSDQDLIWVGRVRRDISNPEAARGITFWCCGDQIRKGAATNAVQIAKLLCE